MADIKNLLRHYERVDTDDDHIERNPLDVELVYEWINKHSENGISPRHGEWEAIELLSQEHQWCICGHWIQKNMLIRNTKTKKSFVVGSKCVDKIKRRARVLCTTRICQYCGEHLDHTKRKLIHCMACNEGLNNSLHIVKENRFVTFMELLETKEGLCDWVLIKGDELKGKKWNQFQRWLLNYYEVETNG